MPNILRYYFQPQVTRFIILFVERSGSTYLATSLASHPQIHALREQFAILRQEGKTASQQLEWANQFYTVPWVGRNKALGFKTKMVDILDPAGFAQLLERHKTRVIVLLRRNSVKAVVSTINAQRLWEKTGNWNLLNEKDRNSAFEIDPNEFDRLLRLREQWDQEMVSYASRLSLPQLTLYYEDLLVDEDAFLNTVYSFINVENKPAHGVTIKNTKDDLREAIVNFTQLRARYSGTIYEPMFDEVLAS